jgi:hypothetical protein
MNHTELTAKTVINDIEPKLDKNFNPYFKLSLQGFSNYCYAFSYNLSAETLRTLKETPEQFINQLALIAYQELPNRDNQGTFFKVKDLQLIT